MENTPKVYIGIPTINRPQFVGETVNSVLSQTFTNFRLTVSDNCSVEEAVETVRQFVGSIEDDRVGFYAQSSNLGEYGQGRYFFNQAQDYDYFVILHDDDVLESDYLRQAVETLERNPDLSLFFANPDVIDEEGASSHEGTRDYLENHGRNRVVEGKVDILENYLMFGLSPISGTVFRMDTLRESGFVDGDGVGNFPFECDLFLRLGDIGARGWFAKKQLVGFRFHRSSMRNYINIYDNRNVVESMIKMFSERQYSSNLEAQRRRILCRLYRALALICLREGDIESSRSNIKMALRMKKTSPKTWMVAPLLFLAPKVFRSVLPELPENLIAPKFSESANGN